MAQSSSVFLTATEARQSYPREVTVHEEARAIESAILSAVNLGLFEATLKDGSPMTNSTASVSDVWTVDIGSNQLFVPNHGLYTGDMVTVTSTISLPSPLSSTSFYYIIYVDSDHVKLAASYSDAVSGRPIAVSITAGVISATITEVGSGYLQPPLVSFSGGNPSIAASARAYLSNYGSIIAIANSTNGQGYIDQPTVTITPRGYGAVAGDVTYKTVGISVNNSGLNYSIGDILTVSGGAGTAATARVTEIDQLGSIVSLILVNPGAYLILPTLADVATTVLPGGGAGATVNLTMGIAAIAIDNGGADYTHPPLVKINDISGVGAIASSYVIGGSVTTIIISNPGYGYVGVSSVELVNGGGASAIVSLQPTGVSSIVITNNGGDTYTSIPSVSIDPQGSGASAGLITMKVVSIQITSSGIGYSKNDYLLVSGGIFIENAYIRVTSVDTTGRILTYNLESGGIYTDFPGLLSNPVSGGTGTLAAFNISMGINSVSVGSGGNTYVVPPTVAVTSPGNGGTTAIVQAVLTSGVVSEFKILNSGSRYTNLPVVSVQNGSGATAGASLTPTEIADFTIDNGGYGYTTATVQITGGGATVDATAIANIVGGSIDSITIIDPGQGYIDIPTVIITGDGSNASVTAILEPTSLEAIDLITSGTGYNTPPVVSIEGSATAFCTLTPTGIQQIIVVDPGSEYTSDPVITIVPGPNQTGTPSQPAMTVQRGYGVASIAILTTGDSYQSTPDVIIAPPQIESGVQATATAAIGVGSGTFAITPYHASRDYYSAWKGQTMSNSMLLRPYNDRMNTVIAYFTNLGYTINRLTNPATNNTFMWNIQW